MLPVGTSLRVGPRLAGFDTSKAPAKAQPAMKPPSASGWAGSAVAGGLVVSVRAQRGAGRHGHGPCVRRLVGEMDKEGLTLESLASPSDFTITDRLIERLGDDGLFGKLGQYEEDMMILRDDQDAEMLKAGIQKGIDAGALAVLDEKPVYEDIDITRLEAPERAKLIASKLPPKEEGCVVILVGKSGTGKETTFRKLQEELPKAVAWSNGNCFRALTLLAVTHCQQQGRDFDPECLTPENLETWVGMLQVVLEDASDTLDIRIRGLTLDTRVSEIKDTILKDPPVSELLPVVARSTQAQVLAFAGQAANQAAEAGRVVLLEGREETLDFVPSPYRFRLMLPSSCRLLRGQRRAAQRIVGEARGILSGGGAATVSAVLEEAMRAVAARRNIEVD